MFFALTGAGVIAAAFWFLASGPPPGAAPAPAIPADAEISHPPARADSSGLLSENGPVVAAPTPPVVRATVPAVNVLEAQYRAARSTEARMELIRDVAGWNDADAVRAITRLFAIERHPEVKVALLSGLADIDAAEAPDVRLNFLATALRGEARDVRIAALVALDQLDDPRATAILAAVAKADPDREVRESAATLHRAR